MGSAHLHEPFLHCALSLAGLHSSGVGHTLTLITDHCTDVDIAVKVQSCNSLEALLQVRLHTSWIFRLTENLKHLIV